jgi:hypothetical protein
MIWTSRKIRNLLVVSSFCLMAGKATAQTTVINRVQHVGFNSPEGWALKYFTSATSLSGLQPPAPLGEHATFGSVTLGLETDWLPALSPDRARVGFTGKKEEDLNKAPILARPSVRVGLPWRLSVLVSAPFPVTTFGITPRLFALGVERPILERENWTLGWRISGQTGFVRGAFTCPERALSYPAGSPQNPTGCVGTSADEVHLRYAGTEAQFAYRLPKLRRLVPHVAEGINYADSYIRVNAPLQTALDHSRLWTRGRTFYTTAGASYLLTNRTAITIDAFYAPLGVQRNPTGPVANDGLFNVRALWSYSFH